MWPWKQRFSLENVGLTIVLLVHSQEQINQDVESTHRATSLGRAALTWEIIALRFFYARLPILDLRDYRSAIDALHRVFFEVVQREYGLTDPQVAQLENWLASRISAYTEALNSAVTEGRPVGDSLIRVMGSKFAEFAGLPKYGLESASANGGAAALSAAVMKMVESVQIVVS